MNPKTGIRKTKRRFFRKNKRHLTEEKWQVNKHLLSLARHYGFTPRRCQVRRPQTKGKVERFIHFYDNNFWVEKNSSRSALMS
jgi:transposase